MAILTADIGTDSPAYVYAIRDDLLAHRTMAPGFFSGDAYPMRTIRVGGIEYQLRQTIHGRVDPTPDGGFEFILDALAPHIVGRGPSAAEAMDDWRLQVHAAIQQGLAMRPFEMTAVDAARWQAFESVIDTAALRRSTPIRMRQLGRVDYMHYPYPRAIHWAGAKREQVSLDVMPSEFPSFKPDQWIEAICERDPLTGRLLRVTHIERIPEVRLMSREQQDRYWETLPTSSSLPESDLDWTRAD